jgi:hypothetical protein
MLFGDPQNSEKGRLTVVKRASSRPKTPRLSNSKPAKRAAIAATLESIEKIEAETAKAAEVIALLKSWLTDESGYDEKTWPKLKKALSA